MPNYRYIPKKGDEVSVLGQNGPFKVIAVKTEPNFVEVKLIGPREFILKNIPWGSLTPLKKRPART
ncbi:MAG TPA: hypothetical protein VK596_00580 [Edaphobacter sp.]|nr:hypothetical protein [Edaphobacter sp.]